MKTILCFGDSNTYGLKPDGTGRFDRSVRYPGRLQELLGGNYYVIEEGWPGRTTVFDDINNPYKKGIDYFIPACARMFRWIISLSCLAPTTVKRYIMLRQKE